jgi:isochorismate synthase/2-succinyl-5-enolpyruvyl-6-hydroxy-3-cyclohexene-1-carboxylate synthase/2-succinyl-6-hydroxy-2,4-cyclohexadiene-1-carboxylate synthase/O-succinylbenzoate synthase
VGPEAEAPEHLYDGVAALVLKPAVLGGFERAAELAAWAEQRGMLAVVSSCFESSLGIAQLGQLAAALDTAAPAASSSELAGTAHGLATLRWLAEDLLPAAGQEMQGPGGSTGSSMSMSMAACDAAVSAAVMLALGLDKQQHQQQQQQQQQQQLKGAAGAAHSVPQPRFNGGLMRRRSSVAAAGGSYDFSLLEAAPGRADGSEQPPMLLLHGFMGGADDWAPLMPALGLQRRCLAIDLPGHGSTLFESGSSYRASSNGSASSNGTPSRSGSSNGGAVKAAASEAEHLAGHSLEAMAEAVAALVEREGLQGCLLAGYSLGGRLALLLAARWPHLFSAVACISGACQRG